MTIYTLDSNHYLTPHELKVVRLLAIGHHPKEIAHLLGTASGTVLCQIQSAKKRLGTNTYNLTYQAHKMGIIQ